jgi:serine protease DegS
MCQTSGRKVDEIVIAVGHPLGQTATITQGIVSATARLSWGPAGPLPSVYIQTDASINHGNSGGALAGSDGMVLGITTICRLRLWFDTA